MGRRVSAKHVLVRVELKHAAPRDVVEERMADAFKGWGVRTLKVTPLGDTTASTIARAHPLRALILEELCASTAPLSPKLLAERTGRKLNVVAYHVHSLLDDELIRLAGEERRRGAIEHFYEAAL